MPAKLIQINLLGSQDLEHTPWGRLITWATTYGRYIMITTEIIVLLAFISRFSLDRKNTDLTEEISQKQAIIEANIEFERDIKSLQANLSSIKTLIKNQSEPVALVDMIETLIPIDVYLTSFDITQKNIQINAVAGSTGGFAQFLSNLHATKLIQNVMLTDISRSPIIGIEFKLIADIPGVQTK